MFEKFIAFVWLSVFNKIFGALTGVLKWGLFAGCTLLVLTPLDPNNEVKPDDLIDAMLLVMNTKEDFIGPVNVGNPDEISINQLASLIIKLTKSKSQKVFMPLPSDDPVKRKPDITKAISILNWYSIRLNNIPNWPEPTYGAGAGSELHKMMIFGGNREIHL